MIALDEDLRPCIRVGFANQPLIMAALLRLWPGLRLHEYDLLVKVGLQRRGGHTWSYNTSSASSPFLRVCVPQGGPLNKISGSRDYVVLPPNVVDASVHMTGLHDHLTRVAVEKCRVVLACRSSDCS